MADQPITVGGVALGTPAPAAPATETPVEQYLSELVGEGKKYATPAELAKGKAHADEHIRKIEEENANLRKQMLEKEANSKTIEAVLERLAKLDAAPIIHEQIVEPPAQPVLPQTKEELAAIVRDLLHETAAQEETRKREEAQTQNQKVAWDKLAEKYGKDLTKAQAAVAEYVGQDANRAQALDALTRVDPDAFVALMVAQKPGDVAFTVTDPNKKPPVDLNALGELNWNKAKLIKKQNPDLYNSRQFQQALIAARDRDPKKFWGGIR